MQRFERLTKKQVGELQRKLAAATLVQRDSAVVDMQTLVNVDRLCSQIIQWAGLMEEMVDDSGCTLLVCDECIASHVCATKRAGAALAAWKEE